MITTDASTSSTLHRDLVTERTAPAPVGGISSADRLMLHIVVGLILGAAFAVAHENWLMIIVGTATKHHQAATLTMGGFCIWFLSFLKTVWLDLF